MKYLKKVSLILILLIFSIVIFEIILNIIGLFFSTENIVKNKNISSDKKIILCIGDSMTYDNDSSYNQGFTHILEELLNKKNIHSFGTYNYAKPGMTSTKVLEKLKTLKRQINIHTAIVMSGACDFEIFIDNNNSKKEKKSILEKSKTLSMLKYLFMKHDEEKPNNNIVNQNITKVIQKIYPPDTINKKSTASFNEYDFLNKKGNIYKALRERKYVYAITESTKNNTDENIKIRAYAYIQIGAYHEAEKLINSLLEKYPEKQELYIFDFYIKAGKNLFTEALKTAQKSLNLNNADISTSNLMSFLYNELGMYETAHKWSDYSLNLNNTYGESYNYLAHIFWDQGDFKNAEKYFLQGIKSDSNYILNYSDLAYLYNSFGYEDKALDFFDLTLKKDNFNYDAMRGKAFILINSTDPKMVKEAREIILKTDTEKLNDTIITNNRKKRLEEIFFYCKENNINLIFQNYPTWENTSMKELSEQYNIPFINNYKAFLNKQNSEKFFITGKSLSYEGNKLIAESIFNTLLKYSIIKENL